MIEDPKKPEEYADDPMDRFMYKPGELQPYGPNPNHQGELTETDEDEIEEDPFQMTDEELDDKLKEF